MSKIALDSDSGILDSQSRIPSVFSQIFTSAFWKRASVDRSSQNFSGACLVSVLVIAGSFALMPLWIHMSRIWFTDSLRIIGIAFPPIALLGVLGAWRRLGWSLDGTFAGLIPMALAVYIVRFSDVTPTFPVYRLQYLWVVHTGPVLFFYGVGCVLLFGGWRLLRAAILPLCLLLCISPVPHTFNTLLDMPLQELSANTARGFAHLIGLHPTGVQLKMMFSPDFGMMIVPGCDGVRGSITLAYLALIYGYVRRLRPSRLAMVIVLALFAGYAFNLLRLCVLVVYYRIGLSVPSIQPYGAGVDYAIGCTIFLLATFGLGFLIRSLEPSTPLEELSVNTSSIRTRRSVSLRIFYLQVLCFIVLTGPASVRARALVSSRLLHPVQQEQLLKALPVTVGSYKLVRTYTEQQYSDGTTPLLVLGDYAGPTNANGVASHMTLGLFVAWGYHRVVDSKLLQGQKPLWESFLDVSSNGAQPIHFGTSFYDDGQIQEYNAETSCSEQGCSNPLHDYERFSFSNYRPSSPGKHLPILLRSEWPEADKALSIAHEKQFEEDARNFGSHLDVASLLNRAGTPLD